MLLQVFTLQAFRSRIGGEENQIHLHTFDVFSPNDKIMLQYINKHIKPPLVKDIIYLETEQLYTIKSK